MGNRDEGLEAVNKTLQALLLLQVEERLQKEASASRRKARSLDRLLTDAGFSSKEVGRFLGKTDRAVRLVIEKEAGKEKATDD